MPNRNKKEKEAQRREELKKQRAERKARRREAVNLVRNEPTLPIRESFLIVCEGKNTEPSYFELFKLTNADIDVHGEGRGTISLVDVALERLKKSKKVYDHKWVVYDKDDFPEDQFDNAIHKANANGFEVAYSNQAFEYWLLLHFEAHQGGGLDRKECLKKFNNYLDQHELEYDPNAKKISKDIFDLLLSLDKRGVSLQDLAIERAIQVAQFHSGKPPHGAESSTTVHLLVSKLKAFMR